MNKKEYLDLLAKELNSMSYGDVRSLKVLVIPSSSQVSSRTATAFLLS